jgi:hypothetical protein
MRNGMNPVHDYETASQFGREIMIANWTGRPPRPRTIALRLMFEAALDQTTLGQIDRTDMTIQLINNDEALVKEAPDA